MRFRETIIDIAAWLLAAFQILAPVILALIVASVAAFALFMLLFR